jgi:hypothetical protein
VAKMEKVVMIAKNEGCVGEKMPEYHQGQKAIKSKIIPFQKITNENRRYYFTDHI